MSLNDTPSGERLHIGFFGRRNAGKSSLVNAVAGQEVAVVSAEKGTTTDPVTKAMELLPLGPVLLIDTPGFDDAGSLGELRVKRTRRILNKTDIAVLVLDDAVGITDADEELLQIFHEKNIPHLIVRSKCDDIATAGTVRTENELCVSAVKKFGIEALKERLAHLIQQEEPRTLVRDLLSPQERVLLIGAEGTPHPAAAAGDPRHPRSEGTRARLSGDGDRRRSRQLQGAAKPRRMRQPGLPKSGGCRARDDSADLLFHPHGSLQRLPRRRRRRCRFDSTPRRRRYGAHRRGLHAPSPMQRHRHGQDSALAHRAHKEEAAF